MNYEGTIKTPSGIVIKNLTGNKVGPLTVIGLNYKKTDGKRIYWDCLCVCGSIFPMRSDGFKERQGENCGCRFKRESVAYHKWPEYKIWSQIKQRCYNPACKSYKRYGGKGVKMCERWLLSFMNFYEDMGKRPMDKPTLDRFPNGEGDYELSNCRWADYMEQNRNKKSNVWVIYKGEKMIAVDFCRRVSLCKSAVLNRLKMGQTPDEIAAIASMRKIKSASLIPYTFGHIG